MDRTKKYTTVANDKLKKSKCCSVLKEVFEDYCSSTSIHGIGYVGAKDKNLFEKIWWIIVFILSVVMCAILISKAWNKWVTSPVIVSFDKEQTPIWQIPFPAVTICPINKIRQSDYNYTKQFNNRHNLTGEEKKLFWDLSLVCNLDYFDINSKDADKLTDETAIKSIIDAAPTDFLTFITWQYEYVMDDFFVPVLTKEGLCYTANMLSQNDMFTDKVNADIPLIGHNISNCGWTMENGYPQNLSLKTYPRRTAKDGYTSGLSLTLKTPINDIDYLCGVPASGYKLILHNPAELPRPGEQYILIPFDRLVAISLYPESMTTSSGLLSVDPKIRNCYFSHEKSLMFFKIYSENNCKLECLTNLTKAHCGCTPFHLPHNKNTSICGYGHYNCMDDVRTMMLHFEMIEKQSKLYKDFKKIALEYQIYKKCDCLASCSYLKFTSETTQTTSNYLETTLSFPKAEIPNNEIVQQVINGTLKMTQVDIFFREKNFLTMHRSELYGQTDFLANCGGLLGLFMGFSLLSVLEIVYFITIRVYCKVWDRKKANHVV